MRSPEDIPVSFSVIPAKSMCLLLDDDREAFEKRPPEGMGFEELIAVLVKKHFLGACQRMMPLLETVFISSIRVKLDISSSSTETMATYNYGTSDAAAGLYVFRVMPALIHEYLGVYFNRIPALSPGACYTWEHELVHMLDHYCIAELDYNNVKPDITEVLVEFMLLFRSEGIAELIFFMKNHSKYRSIKAGRTRFLRKLETLRNLHWESPSFARNVRRWIWGDLDYYSVGTWMVLHVLGCEAYRQYTPEAALVAEKIKKRREMTDEEIIRMIRKALEIDNHDFIECIMKPGPDGRPFVEFDELFDIARTVEICKADLERVWSKPSTLSGDPKIVKLFRLMRPKPERVD